MKYFLISTGIILLSIPLLGQNPYEALWENLKGEPRQSLFLLGTYAEEEGYKTYGFERTGKGLELVFELPYLASPQPEGFYYIQEHLRTFVHLYEEEMPYDAQSDSVFTEYAQRFLYVARSKEELQDSLLQQILKISKDTLDKTQCESCLVFEERNGVRINYLIPGYAAFSIGGEGLMDEVGNYRYEINSIVALEGVKGALFEKFASESPRNSSVDGLTVVDFKQELKDRWEEIERTLYFKGIEGIFVEGERAQIQFDLANYEKIEIGTLKESPYQVDYTYPDYILSHREGLVQLEIRAHAFVAPMYSDDYQVTTSYLVGPIGKKYRRHNTLPFDFSAIQTLDDAVEDVFLSPTKDVIFLLKKDLEGQLSLEGLSTKSACSLLKKTISGQVVMAEWGLGRYAANWKAILSK